MPADRKQRCIVKVSYVRHGRGGAAPLKAHARYLERDSAGSSDPFGQGYLTRHGQDFFGTDGERLEGWQTDRHHFRLVISPEHGDRLDLSAFTRTYMEQLEQELANRQKIRAPLEWAAVCHHNTDHPHVHVVLRGKTQDGRDLVIPKPMIKRGFRQLGQDLATERLGLRTSLDIERAQSRQTDHSRVTDIVRTLQQAGIKDPSVRRYKKDLSSVPIEGRIERLDVANELNDTFFAIVKADDGQRWYVELSHGQADRLKPDDRIRLSTSRTLPSGKTTRKIFVRIENLSSVSRQRAVSPSRTVPIQRTKNLEIDR